MKVPPQPAERRVLQARPRRHGRYGHSPQVGPVGVIRGVPTAQTPTGSGELPWTANPPTEVECPQPS